MSRRLSLIGMLIAGLFCQLARADKVKVWFGPPESSADFHLFYDLPSAWSSAASKVDMFSIDAQLLGRSDPVDLAKLFAVLRENRIALGVSLGALTANKNVCGNRVEGMIWPGEARSLATRLKALGADVEYFNLDLPLTSGHITTGPTACNYSIRETAQHLATSIRELRAEYPNAKFIDAEVPTGMPASKWIPMLREWLVDYKEETGEDFYAFALDMWWEFQWKDVLSQAIPVIHSHGTLVGTFVDSDGGADQPAAAWIAAAKSNACAVKSLQLPTDIVSIYNWFNPNVRNLPETDPATLTSLVNWYSSGSDCADSAPAPTTSSH